MDLDHAPLEPAAGSCVESEERVGEEELLRRCRRDLDDLSIRLITAGWFRGEVEKLRKQWDEILPIS